jgi:hypothetical protein
MTPLFWRNSVFSQEDIRTIDIDFSSLREAAVNNQVPLSLNPLPSSFQPCMARYPLVSRHVRFLRETAHPACVLVSFNRSRSRSTA